MLLRGLGKLRQYNSILYKNNFIKKIFRTPKRVVPFWAFEIFEIKMEFNGSS